MKSVVKLLDVSRVMADCLFQFSDHHIFPLLLKCFNVSIVCGIILSLRAESVVGCFVLSQEEIGIRCQLCFRYSSCAQIYFIHFVNNDGCHLGFNLPDPLISLVRSWYLSTFSCFFRWLLCLQALQCLLGVACYYLCLQLQCLVVGVTLRDRFGYSCPTVFWRFPCLSLA